MAKMKRLLIIISLLIFLGASLFYIYNNFLSKILTGQNNSLPTEQSLTQASPETEEKTGQITLDVLQGEVVLTRKGSSKNLQSPAKENLENEDKISTKINSLASINYPEGTSVKIAPESAITIQADSGLTATITHNMGKIFVRFKKILGIREEFEVETPTAVATVRGTAFSSWVMENKTTRFTVTEDIVSVFKKDETTGKRIPESEQKVDKEHKADVPPGLAADIKKAIKVSRRLASDEENSWLELNTEAKNETSLPATDSGRSVTRSAKVILPSPTILATKPPLPTLNQMPGEGFIRSQVKIASGSFPLSCIGARFSSIRVVTDAASDSDCRDNCPVLPLVDYIKRNNAFAAMNGMYFCPQEYSACAGKTNSFDTLFFNSRLKRYYNSDNNVYSVLPFFGVDSSGNPVFKAKTLEWGRDTNVQAGTAGNPLLIQNGNLVATESGLDEKQKTVKSNRGAIVQKNDILYLCVVGNATVLDTANVYASLKVDNAMNIDGGGSSALWINGNYVYGPGRNIPTAIMFVRK